MPHRLATEADGPDAHRGGCWIWTGRLDDQGRPTIRTVTKSQPAARAYWERIVGPVPEGKVLANVCREPLCVRPWHHEPMSHRQIKHHLGLRKTTPERARAAHSMRNLGFSSREIGRALRMDPERVAGLLAYEPPRQNVSKRSPGV